MGVFDYLFFTILLYIPRALINQAYILLQNQTMLRQQSCHRALSNGALSQDALIFTASVQFCCQCFVYFQASISLLDYYELYLIKYQLGTSPQKQFLVFRMFTTSLWLLFRVSLRIINYKLFGLYSPYHCIMHSCSVYRKWHSSSYSMQAQATLKCSYCKS